LSAVHTYTAPSPFRPSAQDLQVDVVHEDGGVVVRLAGELDLAGAPLVEATFQPLRHRYDAEQITIDCAALSFLDATGLGTLQRVARAWGTGHRMALVGPRPNVQRVLDLCEADQSFAVGAAADT
jgi:anti-anti-sigma factor